MIQPNYPKYKIVETLNNKSSEYLLTANDLAMVCPFKQPLPVQNSFGQTGIQMPTCSSMCPHFKISVTSDEDDFLEFMTTRDNEVGLSEVENKPIVVLTCGKVRILKIVDVVNLDNPAEPSNSESKLISL